ncbi:AraC-like ligand-binding domain-containing protein [Streptomyces olivaceoviridis]
MPAHRRRLYWREALSRTFGAVDISVPEEVYSSTVRTSPLGRIRGVTVEGDPMQTLRTRRLIAGSTNDNHVVVMLLSRGNARVEQDKRDVHVRSGALFVYDRARPLRLTFPEPFQTKSLVLSQHVLDLGESDLRQITAAPLGRESPLGTLRTGHGITEQNSPRLPKSTLPQTATVARWPSSSRTARPVTQ